MEPPHGTFSRYTNLHIAMTGLEAPACRGGRPAALNTYEVFGYTSSDDD